MFYFTKFFKDYLNNIILKELWKFQHEIELHIPFIQIPITSTPEERAKIIANSITKLLVNHFKRLFRDDR